MKKAKITSFTAFLFCFFGCTQKVSDSQIPDPVKSSFAKFFPGSNAEWKKDSVNFEAEFKKDGKSMSASFDVNGQLVETETTINESAFPEAGLTYIQSNFKGKSIKELEKISKADGSIRFEAEVDDKELLFDQSGKLIKEEKD
jgi:hypothetical protein